MCKILDTMDRIIPRATYEKVRDILTEHNGTLMSDESFLAFGDLLNEVLNPLGVRAVVMARQYDVQIHFFQGNTPVTLRTPGGP